MKVKYNRTSTIQQEGKRFDLDKNEYDLTLFDKGVSGKIPFSERTEGNKLTQLVNDGKVSEVVVEELSRLGRNTIDTLTTLKFFEDNEVNVIVKSMGNLQSMVNGKKNPIWNLITRRCLRLSLNAWRRNSTNSNKNCSRLRNTIFQVGSTKKLMRSTTSEKSDIFETRCRKL